MLEFLSELFLPPYEIYDILIIVLLFLFGVYTLFEVVYVFACYKVSRFFKTHQVENGKITKYQVIKGADYYTLSPLAPGVTPAVIVHTHQSPDQYEIILECCCSDERFLATYEISAEEYKEHMVGEIIQIEEDWEPIGFQLL